MGLSRPWLIDRGVGGEWKGRHMTSAPPVPDLSDPHVVGRFVVRARRRADLSQRDLAARVGVAPATIARLEAGHGLPGLALLVRVLAAAGLHLNVATDDGTPVAPVARDVVRDNAGRRFPAHLDVAPPDQVPEMRRWFPRHDRPEARGWFHHRSERDRSGPDPRARERPTDHPTERELAIRRRLIRGPQPRSAARRSRRSSARASTDASSTGVSPCASASASRDPLTAGTVGGSSTAGFRCCSDRPSGGSVGAWCLMHGGRLRTEDPAGAGQRSDPATKHAAPSRRLPPRDVVCRDSSRVGHPPIRARTSYSSGKKVRSSARRRNATPLDPPVPVFWPIVRWTTWR